MEPGRLKAVPFFSAMSKGDLAAVAQQTDEIDVPAGKVLAREGDFGEEFFLIDAGTAQVTRGGEPIAELGPGDFFGEMALLEQLPRTASARSVEKSQLHLLYRSKLDTLLHSYPRIGISILGHLAQILSARLRRVSQLAVSDAARAEKPHTAIDA
jgi:CRP-like cAMP-binding protein